MCSVNNLPLALFLVLVKSWSVVFYLSVSCRDWNLAALNWFFSTRGLLLYFPQLSADRGGSTSLFATLVNSWELDFGLFRALGYSICLSGSGQDSVFGLVRGTRRSSSLHYVFTVSCKFS